MLPPCDGMKKGVPTVRSSSSSVTAAESAGSASSRRTAYVSIAQTKSGIRIHVMPGARMLWIVTMKLIAPSSEESVRMWMLRIQYSWPWQGLVKGEFSDSVGYDHQPACAAPPFENQLSQRTMPPSTKNQ